MATNIGNTIIGRFLYSIGLILTFFGIFIFVNWDIRRSIGGRLKPFLVASTFTALGLLLMIIGYYFPLMIRPFIH